jgi:hypothetical protein
MVQFHFLSTYSLIRANQNPDVYTRLPSCPVPRVRPDHKSDEAGSIHELTMSRPFSDNVALIAKKP